jgi:D-xylose transport system substrate-binding protein
MTIYKAIRPEAEGAAQLAYDLSQGKKPQTTSSMDNGQGQIPSVLLKPVAVTKANINDTIIKDGFWKSSQLCTGQFAAGCKSAGIQ